MKAAVVILNWNTSDYLRRFVPSVAESCRGLDSKLFVADSGSTDDSLSFLQTCGPEVGIIPLGENLGFTGGYNKALSGLEGFDYFVLLNSDIEVSPDWLRHLVGWMDSHPGHGICAPKLLSFQDRERFEYAGAAGGYVDMFGYPYCRGRVLKRTETDCGQYDVPKDVLWVSGAALMIRSSLWRDLGGLDNRFFAHMEEIDLCWRAGLQGWKVTVVPQSVVYHIGGGTLAPQSPFKLKLNFRNSLLMLSGNLAPTFVARGLSAQAAARKSARFLIYRRFLDGASWCVYVLTGKPEYARAVILAHKEFRSMRNAPSGHKYGRPCSPVPGYTGVLILPAALILRGRVFNFLRKYENRH